MSTVSMSISHTEQAMGSMEDKTRGNELDGEF